MKDKSINMFITVIEYYLFMSDLYAALNENLRDQSFG